MSLDGHFYWVCVFDGQNGPLMGMTPIKFLPCTPCAYTYIDHKDKSIYHLIDTPNYEHITHQQLLTYIFIHRLRLLMFIIKKHSCLCPLFLTCFFNVHFFQLIINSLSRQREQRDHQFYFTYFLVAKTDFLV